MQLDKLYIDEAKRIRKTYLTNLAAIVQREDEIQSYFKMIEDIKKQIEDSEDTNDEFFVKKLLDINDSIDKIKNVILPYYDKIKGLDDSQKLLYDNIKDKYPNITDEEIQEQIVPYITPIDQEFTRNNQELYNKILARQK